MSEKLLRKSAAILLFVGFLCAPAHAQDPTGTLEGQIADPSTAAVSGAEVAARNVKTGLTRTVRSSREGTFHFSNLPVGEYSLTVAATGFAAFSVSPIRINIGQ
ncbi:MAG TPA: carboxypeptidase-like regulatory domain-containing protein, partial [Bryobacteraceae bacterium]|nr:carboxypeptidase-like regulatory domain-containing protein [Bryobacteraceae bacterium]